MATEIRTCYRHGDRRAGVVCQRCDRPICPDCMRAASVGFHCPECTRAGSQKVYSGPQALRPDTPVATIVIIALVLVAYVVDQVWTVRALYANGIQSEGILSLEWSLYGPNIWAGDWWRPFTVGFVHAPLEGQGIGVLHVAFNMFLLFLLGQLLEPALGKIRFVVLYAMSLLGGSALILLVDPEQQTVGASGAVFGLMGAAFIGLRARGIDPFKTGIGPLLVLNLGFTFMFPGVSIAGHLGGLLAGAIGGWLMFDLADRIDRGALATTLLCAGLTVGLYIASLELPDPGPMLMRV